MNKYREGKMERTLKRGLKVPETVTGEADCVSVGLCVVQPPGGAFSTSCAGVAARMLEGGFFKKFLQHCVVRAPPPKEGVRTLAK